MDIKKREAATHTLELGEKYPYDAGRETRDWAHRAARGVLADLQDRRGIKHEFANVDADVREDIIDSLAEVIQLAHLAD